MSTLGKSLLVAVLGVAVLTCAPAVASARQLAGACAPVFGRCGAGKDYHGPTCCEAGSTCTPQVNNGVVNQFYSQCLPDHPTGSPMSPSAPPPMFGSMELDFMTEPMQRAGFNSLEFDLNKPAGENQFGSIAIDLVDVNPVLATLPGEGVGQALINLRACSSLQPHSHPRGTEIAFVTKGEIVMGSLEETGRLITSTVSAGQNFVLPQGLLHFQQNPTCEDAQFLASFPTRDPGTVFAASSFFSLPDAVQLASLGLMDADIAKVKAAALASQPFVQDAECARRCGLSS